MNIDIDRKVYLGAIAGALYAFVAWLVQQFGLPVPPPEIASGLQTAIVLYIQWRVSNRTLSVQLGKAA